MFAALPAILAFDCTAGRVHTDLPCMRTKASNTATREYRILPILKLKYYRLKYEKHQCSSFREFTHGLSLLFTGASLIKYLLLLRLS
jgi:hypothetical protein